jgi:hypothetical protein
MERSQAMSGSTRLGDAVPRKPKRKDVTVKIDAEVARQARTVASYNDEQFAEYLTRLLKPIVQREFETLLSTARRKPSSKDLN